MTKPGKKEPNHDLAHDVIERCFHKGLLFFAPVGAWGQTVKIAPPLTITEEAVREGLAVLGEAVDEAVAASEAAGEARAPGAGGQWRFGLAQSAPGEITRHPAYLDWVSAAMLTRRS